ncbi:hypothetical protein, partial [Escherichia coli]|uniref:hypothetical protein n=1 Tax=Escherichia coli TaxID=562 RepID=UPI001BDB9CEE
HSHIRKIAFRRGDRNPYPPLLIGPPAPSNFYTREIKKMRRAGGRDADMVRPHTGNIHQHGNGRIATTQKTHEYGVFVMAWA